MHAPHEDDELTRIEGLEDINDVLTGLQASFQKMLNQEAPNFQVPSSYQSTFLTFQKKIKDMFSGVNSHFVEAGERDIRDLLLYYADELEKFIPEEPEKGKRSEKNAAKDKKEKYVVKTDETTLKIGNRNLSQQEKNLIIQFGFYRTRILEKIAAYDSRNPAQDTVGTDIKKIKKTDAVWERELDALFKRTQNDVSAYRSTQYTTKEEETTGFWSTSKTTIINHYVSPLAEQVVALNIQMNIKYNNIHLKQQLFECRKREKTAAEKTKECEEKEKATLKMQEQYEQYGVVNQSQLAKLQTDLVAASNVTRALTSLLNSSSGDRKTWVQNNLKNIKIIYSPDGKVESMESVTSYDKYVANDYHQNKLSTVIAPIAELVKNQTHLGAKACFWFAMTPRRAACATQLFQYLLKLNIDDNLTETLFSKHGLNYLEEKAKVKEAKLDIRAHISVCIFYLFMEVLDKNWIQIWEDKNNPIIKLKTIAESKGLDKLNSKLSAMMDKRIGNETVALNQAELLTGKKRNRQVDLRTLPDKFVSRSENKTATYVIGKFSKMFFEHNVVLETKRYDSYSEHLYHGGAKAHDYSALHSLYQVTPQVTP